MASAVAAPDVALVALSFSALRCRECANRAAPSAPAICGSRADPAGSLIAYTPMSRSMRLVTPEFLAIPPVMKNSGCTSMRWMSPATRCAMAAQ